MHSPTQILFSRDWRICGNCRDLKIRKICSFSVSMVIRWTKIWRGKIRRGFTPYIQFFIVSAVSKRLQIMPKLVKFEGLLTQQAWCKALIKTNEIVKAEGPRNAHVSIENSFQSINDLDIHPRSSQLLLLNGRIAYHFLFVDCSFNVFI